MPVAIVYGALAMCWAWCCTPYTHTLNFCSNSEIEAIIPTHREGAEDLESRSTKASRQQNQDIN